MPNRLRWALALGVCLVVTGCGFHFKRGPELPFASLYLATSQFSSFGAEFKRYLESGNKVNVVVRPEDSEMILEILGESSDKQILSLSAAGRVREFELHYRVRYRLTDRTRREWIAPSDVTIRRTFTFNDQELLAKESEEALLFREMKRDALSLLLRRLSKATPPT